MTFTDEPLTDQVRDAIHNFALQGREILTGEARDLLEGVFGVHENGEIEPLDDLPALSSPEAQQTYKQLKEILADEIQAGLAPDEDVSKLVNEVAFTHLNRLVAFKMFKTSKLIERMLQIGTVTAESDIVLDFFAGSGSTGHAILQANAKDNGDRRYILVQLPEPTGNSKYSTIAELTKERLRRAGKKIAEENPMFAGDLGFRVFKLDSTNIRAWEPDRENLPKTLLESVEHLKSDRTEQDILFELLLKLGLDLCVPIEDKVIAGKTVHSIGAGTLLVCLTPRIAREEVELLAQGIVAWHKHLAPAGESTVVLRDSAFADDVAKTNITAILQQHGLENVRSL